MYRIAILGCENSHADNFLSIIRDEKYTDVEVMGVYSHVPGEGEKLAEKYGVPVIAVGDYNSDSSSRTYSTMRTNLESARLKCEKKVNMSFKTFLGGIGKAPTLGNAIDHCFYSKTGVSGKLFQTITSDYAGAYTDHLAIIFDFTLD